MNKQNKTGKKKTKSINWFSTLFIIYGIILIAAIAIALIFGVGSNQSTEKIVNQALETNNQLEQPESTCESPNKMIGDRCCIPNVDWGLEICEDEAKKMDDQLDIAINNEIFTENKEEVISDKFILFIPEGYRPIRNIDAGIISIPLYLVGYDENGNTLLIQIFYPKEQSDSSINRYYSSFKQGYKSEVDKLASDTFYSEPEFFKNENGFDAVVFDVFATTEEIQSYTSTAIIKIESDFLIINYMSDNKELFDAYHYEFEDLVEYAKKV